MENRPTDTQKPLVVGLSLVFASFYSSRFSASNVNCAHDVKTHSAYHITKRSPGGLGKQLKPIFLGRKERRKWPNEGEPPPHSRKQAPSLWAAPQPPGQQAQGHQCGCSGCGLHTGPLSAHGSAAVNEKQMATVPCIFCACPSHTSAAGPASSRQRDNLLFILQAEKSHRGRREGGHSFRVSGELMQE